MDSGERENEFEGQVVWRIEQLNLKITINFYSSISDIDSKK
jgi:hypothetical protein